MELIEHYQAFYCEENIWQLAQSKQITRHTSFVCIISNQSKTCAFWHQKAAPSALEVIVWDYHVILLEKKKEEWLIWDLDTLLGSPLPAYHYLQQTFYGAEQWPHTFQPLFRLIRAEEYIEHLSTNRSHMKDPQGKYHKPPPSWDAPYDPKKGHNLERLIDMKQDVLGERLTLQELQEKVYLNNKT